MANPRFERAAQTLACLLAVAALCSIAASQILLGAVLLTLLVARMRWQVPPIWLPLSLFLAGTLVSMAASDQPWAGRPQVKKIFVYFSLLAITTALRSVKDIRLIVLWWIPMAAAASLWSFRQVLQRWQEAQALGRDFYLVYIANRSTGFQSLWMTFGEVQMIALLMILALLFFAPPRHRALAWGAVCLISLSLVLNLTRSVWLGTAAGASLLVWRWRPRLLLALPLLVVLLYVVGPPAFRERLVSFWKPQQVDSNLHRQVVWRTGLNMIRAHPWLGLGPERINRQSVIQYSPPDIGANLPDGYYGHLHSLYIHYAAERGLPTMLMLLWAIAWAFRDFWRRRNSGGRGAVPWVLWGALAVIVAILVSGIAELNLGDSEVLMLFLLVLGFGYVALRETGETTSPAPAG